MAIEDTFSLAGTKARRSSEHDEVCAELLVHQKELAEVLAPCRPEGEEKYFEAGSRVEEIFEQESKHKRPPAWPCREPGKHSYSTNLSSLGNLDREGVHGWPWLCGLKKRGPDVCSGCASKLEYPLYEKTYRGERCVGFVDIFLQVHFSYETFFEFVKAEAKEVVLPLSAATTARLPSSPLARSRLLKGISNFREFHYEVSDEFSITIKSDYSEKFLIEVKSKNEKWSAGDVIRQLQDYVHNFGGNPEPVLVSQTEIPTSAKQLLDAARIRSFSLDELRRNWTR